MKQQSISLLRIFIFLFVSSFILSACDNDDTKPSAQIQELFWVKDQGTEMPVLVSGNKQSENILLVLHGGPGGSAIDVIHHFMKNDLEKNILVAYWDQRMAGLSVNTTIPTSISFEQYALDCKMVIEELNQRFPDKKIVLWGQSWGGLVVSQFITEANYQGLYDGWIIVNGITTNGFDEFKFRRDRLIQLATGRANNGEQRWADSLVWMNALPFNPLEFDNELDDRYLQLIPELWEIEPDVTDTAYQNSVPPFFTQQDKVRVEENITNDVNNNIDERIYLYNVDSSIPNIAKNGLLIWGALDSTIPIGAATSFKNKLGDKARLIIYPNDGHTPWATELNRKNHAAEVIKYMDTL